MKHAQLIRLALTLATGSAFCFQSSANVTVTPASGGTCLNVSPGAFTVLGTIQVSENAIGDFSTQAATTLILTAPANFEFNPGTGSVSYTGGTDITSASVVVSLSTITVTLSVGGTANLDGLFIDNIEARATSPAVSGQILRLAGLGGTATIAGDAAGAGINHGTLATGGLTFTSAASGNWTDPATWGGMVPNCNALVVVNHMVTADASASVSDITINTGGELVTDNAITVSGNFVINGTGSYTHNNTTAASSTIFAGAESFSPTSTITVNQWSAGSVPLATAFTGSFGNVTLNAGGSVSPWDQDGLFATNTILGTLTISSGQVELDDGTGMTTSLTLQDVLINGTGNLHVAGGASRNLTLVTNNFTDVSTSGSASRIMSLTYGTLDFTVNGDFTVSHTFNCVLGTGSQSENSTIHITGNMNVLGGNFEFIKNINGTTDITVDGTTTINTSGLSRMVNAANNDLTFTTDNLVSSGAAMENYFQGSIGDLSVVISNDYTSDGTGRLRFTKNTSNSASVDITIGNDFICSAGQTHLGYSLQDINFVVTGDVIITGGSTSIIGQNYSVGTANTIMTIGGDLVINDGTFTMTQGRGAVTLDLAGQLEVNDGTFWGNNISVAGNWEGGTFNLDNVDYNGGRIYFFDGRITDGKTITVNVANDFNINFLSANDRVHLIRPTTGCNATLDFNLGGDLLVSGLSTTCHFLTNAGTGDEFIDIAGSITITGGQTYFVGTETTGNPHNLTLNVTGEFSQSAGKVVFAALDGIADINITENFTITGGTSSLKYRTGVAKLSISGDYVQTGGTFNFHAGNSDTPDPDSMVVYGNFIQTSGTINFENRVGNVSAEHALVFYGPVFTVGGTGVITHANHLTANTNFGNIYYNTAGTIIYSRTSASHDLQQVRQHIAAGTTLNTSGSAQNFQIASHQSSTYSNHNTLNINGTLTLGTTEVFARQQGGYYGALTVNGGGRLRTQHTGGLYSGTASASAINSLINGNNRMNYSLDANSTVEYYGTDNQVVTGVPNGMATGTQHQYGILDINFQGTADSEFVYPETSGEVNIRTSLVLTAGEFNLDSDHNPINGGMTVNLLNGATTSRTSGYVRSEVNDGSGVLQWNITATGGRHEFPFGYDGSNYIPFIFEPVTGSSGDVRVATYHTLANNTAYPPTVTHVNDLSGSDNSANTVDRFWAVTTTGSPIADITFTATPAEVGTISNPTSQRWIAASYGWEPPQGIQSNPTSNSNLAAGIDALPTWWTLASSTFPLPVELASFTATCINGWGRLDWSTETELNNDYFSVERSTDNQAYTQIGTVNGAGTTSQHQSYAFNDYLLISKPTFYRLVQHDYNGKVRHHGPVKVAPCYTKPVHSIESIYFHEGAITVELAGGFNMNDKARLYNLTGQIIDTKDLISESGRLTITLGRNLPEGVYLVAIGSGERRLVGGIPMH